MQVLKKFSTTDSARFFTRINSSVKQNAIRNKESFIFLSQRLLHVYTVSVTYEKTRRRGTLLVKPTMKASPGRHYSLRKFRWRNAEFLSNPSLRKLRSPRHLHRKLVSNSTWRHKQQARILWDVNKWLDRDFEFYGKIETVFCSINFCWPRKEDLPSVVRSFAKVLQLARV